LDWERVKARDASRITAAEMKYLKNSRIHLDRLQNNYTNCNVVKNNSNFGQITGIQEKLDTTCKQNAL
jgi:predicted phosphatase